MDRDTNVTAVTEVQAGRGPARDTVLLGKYRVESTLGFGGMGLVIKAHNLALDEHVAIKLLREDVQVDNENVTRFVREAKNAVKLKSEHVARIRDVGTFDDGRPYMVMELLEGLDLGKILVDQGVVERDRAVDLVLQACDAIAEAHSLGIVHRDIKPTNLFVTKRRDGTDLLKVLDFGISKATLGTDMNLTQTQSMLGTPAYMSPEQMRSARTVDLRSDIWSLGCVLYELVEGHPPFEAANFAELCVMVSIEPFTPIKNAPELAAIIDKVLAKPIDQRFQSIAELAYALEPFASDPERARRQVARVFRVLGLSHPAGRDSTPMPMAAARGSSSRISQARISSSALPQTPVPDVRDRSGLWKTLLVVGALGVIGAGTWMLVMGQAHDPDPAPPPVGGSAEAVETAPAGSATEMTVERADAAVKAVEAVAPAIDAGLEAGSGSARAETPTKPKQPPRKPPRKLPKPPKPPGTTTSTTPPPPPPPKKKCDPFDNPKGCN